jgi:hypothetical protein
MIPLVSRNGGPCEWWPIDNSRISSETVSSAKNSGKTVLFSSPNSKGSGELQSSDRKKSRGQSVDQI